MPKGAQSSTPWTFSVVAKKVPLTYEVCSVYSRLHARTPVHMEGSHDKVLLCIYLVLRALDGCVILRKKILWPRSFPIAVRSPFYIYIYMLQWYLTESTAVKDGPQFLSVILHAVKTSPTSIYSIWTPQFLKNWQLSFFFSSYFQLYPIWYS